MRLRVFTPVLAALVAATWSLASAQIAPAGSNEPGDPVRVYTNEDLARLDPLPVQEGQPPSGEEIERRWAFVQSVLDQAYSRIDAGRTYEMDRRLTEAEADALDEAHSRPRYQLPFNYGRFGVGYDDGIGRESRIRAELSRLWDPPNAELFRPITPIHARPYQTNVNRLRARQSSGSGRFPRATAEGRARGPRATGNSRPARAHATLGRAGGNRGPAPGRRAGGSGGGRGRQR